MSNENRYNSNVLRQTTVRLQDDILNALDDLTHNWYSNNKKEQGVHKVSMSAVLRCLLEISMPVIETLEDIQNEEYLLCILENLIEVNKKP